MNSIVRAIGLYGIIALWVMAIAFGLLGCSPPPNASASLPIVTKPASQSVSDFITPKPSVADAATVVPPTPTFIAPTLTPAKPTANPVETLAKLPALSNAITESFRPFVESDLYIHLPPQSSRNQPLRVALILHGMGAKGESFAKALSNETDRYNWIIVAPNLPYRDYMEPKSLMEDDIKITKMLADTLDALPGRLNLAVHPRTLVFGFSRGGQLAHRFAMIYPERVESVATLGAGTYTLPVENNGTHLLPFPYGIGDLNKLVGRAFDWVNFKKVSFWVGVGEKDNVAKDVPRQFDPFLGANRVDRARAFDRSLRSIGVDVQLIIYPNAGHEVTGEMRRGATQFFNDCERKQIPIYSTAQ